MLTRSEVKRLLADQLSNIGDPLLLAHTVFQGSMYSNSVTTGDWEGYITRDLVSYVDARYRTIPARGSRGLAGHSMGGYGTIRIAMKHPDVFASIYIMSACCLKPGLNPEGNWGSLPWVHHWGLAGAEAVRTKGDLATPIAER